MADTLYKKMDDNTRPQTPSSLTSSLVICISHSLIGVFLMGYNTALFNIPEDTIRSNASESFINEYLWEIINAMFPIGALFGAAFSGRMADKFGRKKMIILNSIINIVASAITATSFYYPQLLIGRFITGIGSGVATVVCSAYLNEISPDNIRGVIGTLLQIMITIAIVISELFGKIWLVNPFWRYGCCIGGVLCVLQLLFVCTLLESPKWLLAQKKRSQAIVVLNKLHGFNYTSMDIQMEQTMQNHEYNTTFTTMKDEDDGNADDIDKQLIQSDIDVTYNVCDDDNETTFSLYTGLRQYSVIKRIFYISLSLHMFQQLSGINVVFYYSTNILKSAGIENVWLGSVLLSIANFIGVLLITPFIDRWGRKKLLLLSCIGMVISCIAVTISFIFLNKNSGTEMENEWGIFMIICMIFYVMFFEFGLGPIPWIIVAEITPIEYRGSMVSSSQVMNYLCNTIIAATSETLLDTLGVYGFLPFGAICFIASIIIFLYVPETKQKTTKQIVNELDPNYYIHH